MSELHVYSSAVSDGGFSSIQSALDASNDGDIIYVHPGVYTENLVVKTENVNIIAVEGPEATTIIPADLDDDTVRFSGAHGALIQGFTLESGTNSGKQTVHIHGVDGGYELTSGVSIIGNVINRGEGDGIKLSKVSDILIDGNTITGGGDRESGIDMVGGEQIVITNNTIIDMGYVGISLKGGSTNVVVTGNLIDGVGHVGIEIGGYTNLANYIPGYLDSGIEAEIANVLVQNNSISNAENSGFRVIGGQAVAFIDNIVSSSTAAVKIDDSAKYHDAWYSTEIDFFGNSFDVADVIDRTAQAIITYIGKDVFEDWGFDPGDDAIDSVIDDIVDGISDIIDSIDDVVDAETPPADDANSDEDPGAEDDAADDVPVADSADDEYTTQELFGTDDQDKIEAQGSNAIVYAYAGKDRVETNDGADTIYGGDHDDKLYGGEGDDLIFGDDGKDRIEGGDGNDQLFGGLGDDRIYAKDGDDTLDGGAGDDRMEGGDGDDLLFAGSGEADLKGGDGADTFVFDAAAGLDDARVRDFSVEEGDRLNFAGFSSGITSFSDLDSNGNGILDDDDLGIDARGDRIDIEFAEILGDDASDLELRIEGSTLTADCFDFA